MTGVSTVPDLSFHQMIFVVLNKRSLALHLLEVDFGQLRAHAKLDKPPMLAYTLQDLF
jgi:hypothetical protein